MRMNANGTATMGQRRPTHRPYFSADGFGGSPSPQPTAPGFQAWNGDKEEGEVRAPFPSLKKRPAEARAQDIVDELKEAILNPDREDGKTGMNYRDWSKTAHKEITKAIKDAEASAAFRELMSANRIGGLCMRIGFLLMAAVASFASFWYGVLHIWRTYGPIWVLGSTLTALGLSIAFVTAGLIYGVEDKNKARDKAKSRFE